MLKSQTKVLKKPDAAIAIAPRVGKLTATGRKIFNSMMYHAQQQLAALRLAGKVQESRDHYKSQLKDVMLSVGEDPRTRTTQIKKYVDEMQEIKVRWCSPQKDAKVLYASMVLVPSAFLTIENGVLWLHWSFPPAINGLLWDLDRFTVIKLEELSQMTTYTAVALYEICAKYADNPSHKTCVNAPEWWVEVLSNDLGRVNPNDDDEPLSLRPWKSVKVERVIPAIEEINANTGLRIEMIENRVGRKIVSVQFEVRRVKQPQVESSTTPITKDMAAIIAKGISLGLGEMQIRSLFRQGYSNEVLAINLAKLEARKARGDLDAVKNPMQYLNSVLKKIQEEIVFTPGTKDDPSASDSPVDSQYVDEVSDLFDETEIPPEEMPEDPNGPFKAMFARLKPSEREGHLEKLKSSLESRGLFTAHIQRKLMSGDWQSPIIFFELKRMVEASEARIRDLFEA